MKKGAHFDHFPLGHVVSSSKPGRGGARCVGHVKLRCRSADGMAICGRGGRATCHAAPGSCSWGLMRSSTPRPQIAMPSALLHLNFTWPTQRAPPRPGLLELTT